MGLDKTLYITDLDGTILDRNARVPKESCRILNRLMEEGMAFTYATARSIVSSSKVTEGLNITLPVVTGNGVSIVHPQTREVMYSVAFTKEELSKIVGYLRQYDIYPLVRSYVNGKEKCFYVKGKETAGMINFLNLPERKFDDRIHPVNDFDELFEGRVFYISCMGEEHDFDEISKEVDAEKEYNWFLAPQLYNVDYWFEIMPIAATKANAILKLKEMLGYQRIVCFGDGINDVPMFRIADECYAVENAVSELKEIATAVIGSNEEHGVARWLEKCIVL